MLQNGYKFSVREKKVYPPIPEDVYQVELFDITMENVPNKQKDGSVESQDVLKFQFVVLDDGEYRGRSIWRNYVPTYIWEKNNEKNALYQITKAMIQRDMTEEEMKNFSSDVINSLIGFQCRVGTINKAGTGKNSESVYTNIDKFLPKKASMTGLTAEEKEKSIVKNDKISTSEKTMAPVMDSEIPIVGETKVEAAARVLGGTVVEEDTFKITEVPF